MVGPGELAIGGDVNFKKIGPPLGGGQGNLSRIDLPVFAQKAIIGKTDGGLVLQGHLQGRQIAFLML